MSNEEIRTGFFDTRESMREENPNMSVMALEEVLWDIYEETGTSLTIGRNQYPVCIASFLTGFCAHLAKKMSEKFGYEMEVLKIDQAFVHMYCVRTVNGKRVYIDSRGMTSVKEEFVSAFLPGNEAAVETFPTSPENINNIFGDYFIEDEISDAMCGWFLENYGKEIKI